MSTETDPNRPPSLAEMVALLVVVLVVAVVVWPRLARGHFENRLEAGLRDMYPVGLACAVYAEEQGVYPYGWGDGGARTNLAETAPADSNEALRALFAAELMEGRDERLFAGPAGRVSDGDSGGASNGFARAIEPGENGLGYFAGYAAGATGPMLWSAGPAVPRLGEGGWEMAELGGANYGGRAVLVIGADLSARALEPGVGPTVFGGTNAVVKPLQPAGW